MNGSFVNHVFMDVTILKYKLVKKIDPNHFLQQ